MYYISFLEITFLSKMNHGYDIKHPVDGDITSYLQLSCNHIIIQLVCKATLTFFLTQQQWKKPPPHPGATLPPQLPHTQAYLPGQHSSKAHPPTATTTTRPTPNHHTTSNPTPHHPIRAPHPNAKAKSSQDRVKWGIPNGEPSYQGGQVFQAFVGQRTGGCDPLRSHTQTVT